MYIKIHVWNFLLVKTFECNFLVCNISRAHTFFFTEGCWLFRRSVNKYIRLLLRV